MVSKGKVKNKNKVWRKTNACVFTALLCTGITVGGILSAVGSGCELDAIGSKQDELKVKIKSSDTFYDYFTEKYSSYRDAYHQGILSEDEYVDNVSNLTADDVLLSGNFEGCDIEYNKEASKLADKRDSCVKDIAWSLLAVGAGITGVAGGFIAYPSRSQFEEAMISSKEDEMTR